MITGSPRDLIRKVRQLVDYSSLRDFIEERVREFRCVGRQDSRFWFEELVFCILTANSKAELGLNCVEALKRKNLISGGSQDAVTETLEELGHRFARIRAEYIFLARDKRGSLREKVLSFGTSLKAREWLVNEFMGIGWKESSHFLRNVGILDLAILDRHILTIMFEHALIAELPRSLTRKRYLEYESVLRKFSVEVGMPLGKLDLYLWYMKTGKILK